MKRGWLTAIAVVALGHAALAKGSRPAALIADVARGPAGGLDGLDELLGRTHVVDAALERAAGVTSLDGLDGASVHFLLVDADGVKGAALVGKIADADDLAARYPGSMVIVRRGWAAIGPAPVIAAIGDYALASVRRAPAVTRPTATVYLARLLARHRWAVAIFRLMIANQPAGAPLLRLLDGVHALADETDHVTVSVDATSGLVTLDLAVIPPRGSDLASFVAAQRPSDYALLDKLPPVVPGMILAGRIVAGPYHHAVETLLSAIAGRALQPDDVADAAALAHASTGELAALTVLSTAGLSNVELFGVADDQAAAKVAAHLGDRAKQPRVIDAGTIKGTLRGSETTHDGVTIRGTDTSWDLTLMPSHDRAWTIALNRGDVTHSELAIFDGLAAASYGPDALALATRAIDTARHGGGYQPSPEVAALLDASRARKDSAIVITDVSTIAEAIGEPFASSLLGSIALGFDDGAAHVRVTLFHVKAP